MKNLEIKVAFLLGKSVVEIGKVNTGLDRKSANALLFNTRKNGHCTAISPDGSFKLSPSCLVGNLYREHQTGSKCLAGFVVKFVLPKLW